MFDPSVGKFICFPEGPILFPTLLDETLTSNGVLCGALTRSLRPDIDEFRGTYRSLQWPRKEFESQRFMDELMSGSATRLLQRWNQGDRDALDQLLPVVYDELRRLARGYLNRERAQHTLQSTALVHEAYLRLVDQNTDWQGRAHFFGVAAQMMRRILVDHARARSAAKRGDGLKVTLDEGMAIAEQRNLDVLALDRALQSLAQIDEKQCKIVELRYFAGLSIEETAEVLSISPATVKRDWSVAKAWLARAMQA